MLFNSLHFVVFAIIVTLLYFQFSRKYKIYWLLIASLYFYAAFKVPFLFLLLFSIVHTYFFTNFMISSKRILWKKFFLFIVILGDLSVLFFFKYLNFSFSIYNDLNRFFSWNLTPLHEIGIILPMGISFFILQAISYSVDVYRGVITKHHTFLNFSLYLSFFPQLVAGPIIRAKDIIDQFNLEHKFNSDNFILGISQITLGFFKKTIIADQTAIYVDTIFLNPNDYSFISLILVTFVYSIQLYCDFSGYSDIAIGMGRILGYDIQINFLRPFFSSTLSELWSKWHISLSSWLRDYIYIPLGGSRVSKFRSYFNIFITMLVSGLWHGAEWTVIFWGLLHSVVIIIEKFLFSFPKIQKAYFKMPLLLRWMYPYLVFCFSIYFFRAKPTEVYRGWEVSMVMLTRIFHLEDGKMLSIPWPILTNFAILIGLDLKDEFNLKKLHIVFQNQYAILLAFFVMLTTCIIIYSTTISQPFLYFQF